MLPPSAPRAPARCTADLTTHVWRGVQRLLLSLYDVHGFAEQLIVWECTRCQRHVWAAAMVHRTGGPMNPVQWEASVRQDRQRGDVWSGAWTPIERQQRQGVHWLRQSQALYHQEAPWPRRAAVHR